MLNEFDKNHNLSKADDFHQKGLLPEAQRLYRTVLQMDPADSRSLMYSGLVDWRLNGPPSGLDRIGHAFLIDPDVPGGEANKSEIVHKSLEAAVSLHQSGQLAEAACIYRSVLRIDPEHGSALHLLGMVEWRSGNATAGLQLITRALKVAPHLEGAQHNLEAVIRAVFDDAVGHHHAGRLDEAGALYRCILEAKPDLSAVQNNFRYLIKDLLAQASILSEAGQIPEAVVIHHRILLMAPEDANALQQLGLAEWRLGNLASGLARIAQVLEPTSDAVMRRELERMVHAGFAQAVNHHEAGQIDEAAALYTVLLKINPDFSEARNNRLYIISNLLNIGVTYHRAGQLDEASLAYQRVLRIDPKNPSALHMLGLIERSRGNLIAGLDLIKRALACDPDLEGGRYNLANAIRDVSAIAMDLYRKERFKEAADYLGAALEANSQEALTPKEAISLVTQAQATASQLYNKASLASSQKITDKILAYAPSHKAFYLAGLIKSEKRQHREAISYFRSAIQEDSLQREYYNDLEKSLYAVGDVAEAVKTFRIGLEKEPDFHKQSYEISQEIDKINRRGGSNDIPTLLFCTSYIASEEYWNERYKIWLDYYKNSQIKKYKICMIDDGGAYKPERRDMIFHRFDERLGRHSNADFPGWWRSFLFSVELAKKEGCKKIVHVESDAFLLSERLMTYIDALETGWTAFWCPRWRMPESAIQVICHDQFDTIEKIAELDRSDSFFLGGAEYVLPFTNVIKFFKGDRYGEYLEAIPHDADYICQLSERIKDQFLEKFVNKQL